MSPKWRRLSGKQVISIMEQFGFHLHAQRGSHVKLRRITPDGEKQTLTIPQHEELDVGTLQAIVRQAGRYVPIEELKLHFCHSGVVTRKK
jgi:predicted RNA binding protein YcfA (HicA-like mRNA interferase family)